MGFKVKYIWENDWDKYNSGKIDNIKKILQDDYS